MIYRTYGKTGEKVSQLGFGCMRFPTTPDGEIDKKRATAMLHRALEEGVNYFDTAYPYHSGKSEAFVGEALKPYRKDLFIASKLPSWLIQTREDMDKYLNEQLERLQTDHIDFYLLHALDKGRFENLVSLGVFEFLESAKADGRIRHIGFSFHDSLPVFKQIIDSYDWEFCQIQYNYLDHHYQAGLEGLEYASSRGIGIAIMEPLRGGRLAMNIPKDIMELWGTSDKGYTPAQWAFKYLWSDERVHVVLSGMSDEAQVEENLGTAATSNIGELTAEELSLITKVKESYESKIKVNCTDCKYCMPCPFGVDIPRNFTLYNNASLFDAKEEFQKTYQGMSEKNQAAFCKLCGKCEKECPQHIPIREKLKEAASFFI